MRSTPFGLSLAAMLLLAGCATESSNTPSGTTKAEGVAAGDSTRNSIVGLWRYDESSIAAVGREFAKQAAGDKDREASARAYLDMTRQGVYRFQAAGQFEFQPLGTLGFPGTWRMEGDAMIAEFDAATFPMGETSAERTQRFQLMDGKLQFKPEGAPFPLLLSRSSPDPEAERPATASVSDLTPELVVGNWVPDAEAMTAIARAKSKDIDNPRSRSASMLQMQLIGLRVVFRADGTYTLPIQPSEGGKWKIQDEKLKLTGPMSGTLTLKNSRLLNDAGVVLKKTQSP